MTELIQARKIKRLVERSPMAGSSQWPRTSFHVAWLGPLFRCLLIVQLANIVVRDDTGICGDFVSCKRRWRKEYEQISSSQTMMKMATITPLATLYAVWQSLALCVPLSIHC